MANNYFRTITKSCISPLNRMVSPVNILIRNFLRTLNDLLISFYVGILGRAVLANIRGVGEPIFEHDFPPGSDIVGDILSGPKAAERMEHELFSRLAAQVEIVPPKG
jgi:hypothetical protein